MEEQFTLSTKEQVLVSEHTFALVDPSGVLQTAIRTSAQHIPEEGEEVTLETLLLTSQWGDAFQKFIQGERSDFPVAAVYLDAIFTINKGIPVNVAVETTRVEEVTADNVLEESDGDTGSKPS